MGDLIALMWEGRLVQLGAPLELYDNPATAFVAGFIGDPPMSVLHARLMEKEGRQVLNIGGASMLLPEALASQAQKAGSADVLVGLRAHQVWLAERSSDGDIITTVYSHEMVGREQQLMLALDPDKIRCRLTQPIQVKVGDTMRVRLALEGAKLFDAASGRALSARP